MDKKKRIKRLIIAIIVLAILGFIVFNIHDTIQGISDGLNAR